MCKRDSGLDPFDELRASKLTTGHMISPLFIKSSFVEGMMLLILAGLAAFLWLNLRFIQEEIGAMEAEREFLAARLVDLRSDQEAAQEKWRELSAIRMIKVTAYSSTPDQTDDTPFITASGAFVRDGIAAANFLPFGTKIRLPEAFGEKIFIVEDRMKRNNLLDLWFPTRQEAWAFGVQKLKMEILSN